MSKYVDMIAWEDCPHLQPPYTTQEELADFEKRLLPHQRQARRTGRPALGEGAIYPVDEDLIFVEPFRIPEHWYRAWALDPGWNTTAALFAARDPDTNITYLTHEHYEGGQQPVIHAHKIKIMLPWVTLAGAIDPAGDNSSVRDGRKLKKEYEDLGLKLVLAENAVNAGIFHVLTEFEGGTLKVFKTLVYWRKEFRLYRRQTTKAGKSQIVKKNDHLMDCTRYITMTKNLFKQRPTPGGVRGYGEW